MKLEISQLIGLAANAGFSGPDLAVAVSVALAESGGNPNAYNPERAAGAPEGQGSFGLWQIYRHAHPEYAGVNLFDPTINAGAAFAVYSAAGGTFRPWSTFTAGSYLSHMDSVAQVIAASSGDVSASDSGDGGSFTPGGSDALLMFVVGGLTLWALSRALGW